MVRTPLPARRNTWRQKFRITNAQDGTAHKFYVDFGQYPDGQLGEVFICAHKFGTFARGMLDALARTISLFLQNGGKVVHLVRCLRGMHFPPGGIITAPGSKIDGQEVNSVVDYLAREIAASYDNDSTVDYPIEVGDGDSPS